MHPSSADAVLVARAGCVADAMRRAGRRGGRAPHRMYVRCVGAAVVAAVRGGVGCLGWCSRRCSAADGGVSTVPTKLVMQT